MGCDLKIIFAVISASFFIAVVLAALGAFLIVTGVPKRCSDREIVPISEAVAAQLDERWDLFTIDIAAAAASIDITESEATSRARQYIADRDLPLNDLNVYFCGDGKAQLTGKIEALGIDANFAVTGHLDLSGARPVVALDSIDLGNLPGFVSDAMFELLLNENDRTLELNENLVGSEISDGLIRISGEP